MRDTWTISIGFAGGPLDDWSDQRQTDQAVHLPERLVAWGYPPGQPVVGEPQILGEYLVQVQGVGRYTFRWYGATAVTS